MYYRPNPDNPDDCWRFPFNPFPYHGPNNPGCIPFSPKGWH